MCYAHSRAWYVAGLSHCNDSKIVLLPDIGKSALNHKATERTHLHLACGMSVCVEILGMHALALLLTPNAGYRCCMKQWLTSKRASQGHRRCKSWADCSNRQPLQPQLALLR